MGSPNADEQQTRFSQRAMGRIHDATFEKVVSFLRVSDVAKGSQHSHFEKAFPKKEGGLIALIHKMEEDAAATQDHTSQLDGDLMRLVSQIQAQSDTLPAEVRSIATREFMRYYQALEEDPAAQVRALMIAVARFDPEAAELIAARYRITDGHYAERYKALLATLNREPIEPLADYHDFAVTIAAVLNGLLIRANIEQDPKHSRDLFESIIVRFIGAITHPVGSEPLTEEE
ncbi:MAG: hypothetical protein JO144_00885, partial [Actinobacteria bacterium]|nr:hypothetical protein [Actinomycetota bacterium]